MKKLYIDLLKNNYILFFDKKPKKKGNYTNDVRLFSTDGKTPAQDIYKWVAADCPLPVIKEVEGWE